MSKTSESGAPHPDVADFMHSGECLGRVIRCVTSWGTVIDYVTVGRVLPGHWVRITADPDGGLSDGRITGPDAVRNDIRQCLPEVRTVKEEDSLFAQSDGWENE